MPWNQKGSSKSRPDRGPLWLTASLVARAITEAILSELRSIVDRQPQAATPVLDVGEESMLDTRFHLCIARASGNELVAEIVDAIVTTFCSSNRAVLYLSGRIETSLSEHHAIIEAIQGGDVSHASKRAREHRRHGLAMLMQVLANYPLAKF